MKGMLKGRSNFVDDVCLGYYSYAFLESSLFLESSEQIHERYSSVSCQKAVCQCKQDGLCVYWLSCVSLTTLIVWNVFEILCCWLTTGSVAAELSSVRSYLLSLLVSNKGAMTPLALLFISMWGKKCLPH